MSLRDQIDQFMAGRDPNVAIADAIADVFDSSGFDDLDPESVVDALRHYADSSPIDVADELSGFLTDHSEVPLDEFDLTAIDDERADADADADEIDVASFGVEHNGSSGFEESTADLDDDADTEHSDHHEFGFEHTEHESIEPEHTEPEPIEPEHTEHEPIEHEPLGHEPIEHESMEHGAGVYGLGTDEDIDHRLEEARGDEPIDDTIDIDF